MTDDEIRDVFVELRRIGADLGQPPGLAIGTGFREGELLPWLRTLPDQLGHAEFATKLAKRVATAAPNACDGESAAHAYREYPTIEQLNAGIDVLIAEWDPLGARLGELSRENASPVAFAALSSILANEDLRRVENGVASMLAMTEGEFGVRPAPIEQRRYLARRLIQSVREHPGAAHENRFRDMPRAHGAGSATFKPHRIRHVVEIGPRGDEPVPLDPHAACTECSAIGTVAFVTRDSEPHVSRYCVKCWSAVRGKYWTSHSDLPKPDADDPTSMIRFMDFVAEKRREQVRSTGTALWEDHFEFQKTAIVNADLSDAQREESFRQFAGNLLRRAPHMHGPMPPDIETFVTRYTQVDA